jgi:hypothetical protein
MANKNEKGLNRGGIRGQEGELGEESKNLDRNVDVKQPMRGAQEKPGQQRGGMQGGSGQNSDLIRENLKRGGGSQRDMSQQRGGGTQRDMKEQRGGTQRDMKEQRGGLRREPDLEDAEKDTGHEVD